MPKPNLQKIMALPKSENWFRAEAATAAEDAVDKIYIDGVIGGCWLEPGTDAADFRMAAESLTAPTLEVHINSPGGSVDEGMAIYSYLAADPRKIITVVDGMAASIASVILMAGDEIRINAGATVMIHRPWTIACGNEVEMRHISVELGQCANRIAHLYEARTGQTFTAIENLMRGEDGADGTMMDADAAVRLGFADTILPAKQISRMAAFYDLYDIEPPAEEEPEEEITEEITEEVTEATPAEDQPEDQPEEVTEEVTEEVIEEVTEEVTEDIPAEDPVEEEPEEEPAIAPAMAKAMRPATEKAKAPVASDWHDALYLCGGDYVKARRRYPELYQEFMQSK